MSFVSKAIGSITGSNDQAKAAKSAANQQYQATQEANKIAQQANEQIRADLSPYNQAGTNALGQLTGAMGEGGSLSGNYQGTEFDFNGSNNPYYSSNGNVSSYNASQYKGPSYSAGQFQYGGETNPYYQSEAFNFEESPDYQYRLKQGMDGIQSSAAAGGGLQSGATLKALNSHNSNLASQEYSNAHNRYLQDESLKQGQHQQAYNQFLGNQGLQQAQAQLGLQQYATQEGLNQSANAQNLANQSYMQNEFQNAFNNWQSLDNNAYARYTNDQNNEYNRLMSLIGIGQNAAAQTGNAGLNTAQSVANNTMAGANAQAAGTVAAGNATANNFNALLGVANAASGFFGGGKK